MFNITIGAFKVSSVNLFDVDENGEYRTAFKALQRMVDMICTIGPCKFKLTEDGEVGTLNGSVYDDGVLGMMHRKEIDFCLVTLPLDLLAPPGRFSPVIEEENYVIGSFPRKDELTKQDVTHTLGSISWWTILIILLFILIIEMLMQLQENLKRVKSHEIGPEEVVKFTIWKAGEQVPTTLFGQFIPNRSMIRLCCTLGLLMFTCILGATFSTDAVSGVDEKLPETLKDIVALDLKPHFTQSASMFELFQRNASADYQAVYEQAVKKGTEEPSSFDSTDTFESAKSGNAILSAYKIAFVTNFINRVLGNQISDSVHYSKPYHSSLHAFLVNTFNKSNDFKKKVDLALNRAFQAGLPKELLRQGFEETLIQTGLGISSYDFAVEDDKKSKKDPNLSAKPLTLVGFRGLFKFWATGLFICGILEIILFIYYKTHEDLQVSSS